MLQRIVLPLVLLGLVISATAAQEKTTGQRVAELVAPFGERDLVAVARVDTKKIDLPAAQEWLGETFKLSDVERKRIRQDMAQPEGVLKSFHMVGGQEIVFVIFPATTESPGQPVEVAGVAVAAEGKVKELGGFIADVVDQFKLQLKIEGNKVYFAQAHRMELFRADAKASANVVKAMDAGGEATLQAAILLPDDFRRVLAETLPPLPEPFGGASGKDLEAWFAWGSITFTIPPKPQLKLIVQTPSEKAAQSLEKATSRWYEFAAPVEEIRKHVPKFDDLKPLITPKAQRDQVVIDIDGQKNLETLVPSIAAALQTARNAATRAQQMNSMKQIGLAMHNYHDTYSRFPPAASRNEEGKPLLSWRVHLLPYLEEVELYKQFRLDEPWDSEHNKKLLPKMPKLFGNHRVPVGKEGYTTFVVPVGDKSVFADKEGMKIAQITDGTSNTVLVLETDAKHAVPWTKPEDLEFDATDPVAGLFVDSDKHIMLLIADGSVRMISAENAKKVLPPLVTANGGEVVPID